MAPLITGPTRIHVTWLSNRAEKGMSLCNKRLVLCVLDLQWVIVHLYTRKRGYVSSSAHRGGPRSYWTYSHVNNHSNVFFKHGHFEEGATLLSHWKWGHIIRSRDSILQLKTALLMVPKCEIFDDLNFHEFYTIKPFCVGTCYFKFWEN